MMYVLKNKDGIGIYDFEQSKTLEFVYGGNLDYFIAMDVCGDGKVEDDKSMIFTVDKSNIDIYDAVNELFSNTKNVVLKLKEGKKKVYFPPLKSTISVHNSFDINELYDVDKNALIWASEMGSGPNADTVLEISKKENEYQFRFVNEVLASYNERIGRNVCICNSGSRSDIFPMLFWAFYKDLKEVPESIIKDDVKIKKLYR